MFVESILVAVDGSENSVRALDFALDMAEKYVSSVMILNVFDMLAVGVVPQESTAYSIGNMTTLGRDMRKIHEEILSKAVSHAKDFKPDLTISSMLRDGEPAVEIVNFAKDNGFDVIVLGHKGMGKLRERFLGSISEKVAHSAPCSVIIVK
jgi:nucleotide-binding universal stress UspA family protein